MTSINIGELNSTKELDRKALRQARGGMFHYAMSDSMQAPSIGMAIRFDPIKQQTSSSLLRGNLRLSIARSMQVSQRNQMEAANAVMSMMLPYLRAGW